MAKTSDHQALAPLAPGATRVTLVLAQPRALAILCVLVLAGLGWLYLGLMLGSAVGVGRGPGMGVFDVVATGRLDEIGRALYQALCRPAFGSPHSGMPAGWGDFALVTLMWSAMTFAMMLPTAGPMVLVYAEIAETAAAKHERVVSPVVLTAGYVAVWLGFAVAATGLQWGLTRLALIDPALGSVSALTSGAIFVGAGAYQFSALKHACVTVCQRPFPFFLANWSVQPGKVFRLGLRQGLYCLGCCWAMMLVMFAVGTMNVVWMAALGVLTTIEKLATTARFSQAVGASFAAIGSVMVVWSVV
jgi:predicted metal-binding membrane protein